MATDSILLRAILAMDAYNRGYAAGMKLPGLLNLGGENSKVGEATVGKDAEQILDAGSAIGADFYAASYTLADGSK